MNTFVEGMGLNNPPPLLIFLWKFEFITDMNAMFIIGIK